MKAGVGLIVVAMAAREVVRTVAKLRSQGELPSIDPGWLAASGLIYLAGLAVLGFWYWRVLRAGPASTGLYQAERAYYVSHLGKYMPGKALVVVIRSAMTAGHGASPTTSAFAALYETLVMMATGGLVAAIGFATPGAPAIPIDVPRIGRPPVAWASGLLGLGLLTIALPAVFPRLAKLASRPLRFVNPEEMPRFTGRLLLEGVGLSAVGWILLGISQLAVLRAIGVKMPMGLDAGVAVASVALATVAGFAVAVAPGGLGVREWVLWTSLAAVVPHGRAVLAALLLRLVWLAAEVIAAGVLLAARGRRQPAELVGKFHVDKTATTSMTGGPDRPC